MIRENLAKDFLLKSKNKSLPALWEGTQPRLLEVCQFPTMRYLYNMLPSSCHAWLPFDYVAKAAMNISDSGCIPHLHIRSEKNEGKMEKNQRNPWFVTFCHHSSYINAMYQARQSSPVQRTARPQVLEQRQDNSGVPPMGDARKLEDVSRKNSSWFMLICHGVFLDHDRSRLTICNPFVLLSTFTNIKHTC